MLEINMPSFLKMYFSYVHTAPDCPFGIFKLFVCPHDDYKVKHIVAMVPMINSVLF